MNVVAVAVVAAACPFIASLASSARSNGFQGQTRTIKEPEATIATRAIHRKRLGGLRGSWKVSKPASQQANEMATSDARDLKATWLVVV